jgi:hypothetical protein
VELNGSLNALQQKFCTAEKNKKLPRLAEKGFVDLSNDVIKY